VLILPSRLNALAKDVFGTLVVNPGPLTRGVGGGIYAQKILSRSDVCFFYMLVLSNTLEIKN